MDNLVRHWNSTRADQQMTGVKRYEDELYNALEDTTGTTLAFDRVRPHANVVLGSTIPSLLLTYRAGGVDLVHVTEETVLPATYLHRPDSLVVTCHGLIPLRYPSTISDLTTRLQWRLVPKRLKQADRVIAISEFTKSEILSLTSVAEEDIDVVHHGIDHDRYRPMDQDTCRANLDLAFDPEKRYVLAVASTLKQKRMDVVRATFEHLSERRDDIVLLKAGYAEALHEPWAQNTGWIDEADLPKLYNAADVFLHTSEYESFGFPVLEASACGTPVVASNRASIPEVAGDPATLLDPDSADAGEQYAEEVENRLDDRVDRDAVAWSERFTWERTAEAVTDVYERAIL